MQVEQPASEGEPVAGGFLGRLRDNLSKTRQALGSEIQATLFGPARRQTWERLEEALIMADVGASTTASVVGTLESEAGGGQIEGCEALSERLIALLAQTARVGDGRIDIRAQPDGDHGRRRQRHRQDDDDRQARLASAPRARAQRAAGAARTPSGRPRPSSCEGWAQRAECEIVTGRAGHAIPARWPSTRSRRRAADDIDVVIVDTAGRLHTQDDLMAELAKVRRVIARQLEGAPHETLLTIDATTGQNGLRQAKLFAESADVSGVVLTKLDGTARGGIALAIARELALPVKLIGVGESLEDLRPFDPEDFARALIAE